MRGSYHTWILVYMAKTLDIWPTVLLVNNCV